MHRLFSIIVAAAAVLSKDAQAANVRRGGHHHHGHHDDDDSLTFKHVAIFSVDGFHGTDLDKYLSKGKSNISNFVENGYVYSNAYTTWPSDSFPGSLALFSGAGPKTTGVWYDDTYDRAFYAPSSGCKGSPGAEVVYDESLDYNDTFIFSGGIDPSHLPQAIIGGKCTNVYPHSRTRVNTIFELAVAAGLKTAYADKHPAYDLVRGPSGSGLTTGYFPEINSAGNPTDNVSACIEYDKLHVNAFLSWLDGTVPANSEGALNGAVPSLFGGNFQSVSVGQKTKGYVRGTLDFTPDLLAAFNFVDASLGAVVNKLKAKNIYDDTLIVVCSKHGQSPIDPTKFNEVNPANFTSAIGVKTSFTTFDDTALVFLANSTDLSKAVANLQAHKADLHIDQIIYGQQLIEDGFGDPSKDTAVPDIIVQPVEGTIYTTSKVKIAEHGGGAEDDRHVACFVHNPKLKKKTISHHVSTKQVAPTILKVLGLDINKLQGAKAEGTHLLPGFHSD